MRFGPWEIGLVLMIVLIIFGAGKLPDVGRSLGSAIRGFRKAQNADEPEEPAKKIEEKKDSKDS
jgi:sec-independent protein translocase protein TatA